ncbi:MAG: DUF4340 domain-containing protein, partial [Deltaproteobacteria bacterium]
MSLKKTVILAMILILVAGFLFKLKWQEGRQKVERVFIFDPREVEGIRLAKRSQRIILEKEGKEWKVRSSAQAAARSLHDERVIRNLFSIFDYGIIDVIHEHPKNLAEFGLDSPEFEFSIKVNGNPFKTLLIGNNNPTQNSCYA